jgi:hypothetical protein
LQRAIDGIGGGRRHHRQLARLRGHRLDDEVAVDRALLIAAALFDERRVGEELDGDRLRSPGGGGGESEQKDGERFHARGRVRRSVPS